MRLFDFFKKNNLDLIEWQNIVNDCEDNKLTMSKKELLDFTYNVYIPQESRIIDDCVNLVNTTKTIDVYFFRLNLLIERLIELSKLEKFISFSLPLPSTQLEEVLSHKEILNEQFLQRCWENTLDSLNNLKTEKGKQSRLNKFLQSILAFKEYLTLNNLEYLHKLEVNYINTKLTSSRINNEHETINIDKKIKELKEWTKGKPNKELDKWYKDRTS